MTSTLSRYVMRAVLGTTMLVMLVLLTLSGLYLFITQQDEIGVGSYALGDAFLYVGLNLPKYAFDMLPIAALIGALLALGNMARSMELIVVRAAGVSVARIAMWVAGAGIILMLLTAILGELVGRIRSGTYGNIDSLLVVRHEKLVVEEYFGGRSASDVHTLQSVSKSVTSLLTGLATRRHGVPALLRALTRAERAPSAINAF